MAEYVEIEEKAEKTEGKSAKNAYPTKLFSRTIKAKYNKVEDAEEFAAFVPRNAADLKTLRGMLKAAPKSDDEPLFWPLKRNEVEKIVSDRFAAMLIDAMLDWVESVGGEEGAKEIARSVKKFEVAIVPLGSVKKLKKSA